MFQSGTEILAKKEISASIQVFEHKFVSKMGGGDSVSKIMPRIFVFEKCDAWGEGSAALIFDFKISLRLL